jgi:hypothetical protein
MLCYFDNEKVLVEVETLGGIQKVYRLLLTVKNLKQKNLENGQGIFCFIQEVLIYFFKSTK